MKLYIGQSRKGLKVAAIARSNRRFAHIAGENNAFGKMQAKQAKKLMRHEGKFVGANEWLEHSNNQAGYMWDNCYSTQNFSTIQNCIIDGRIYKWLEIQVG